MVNEHVTRVFYSIMRNRQREDLEPEEKQDRHDALVEKYFKTVQEQEKRLADRAFKGFEADHSLDPMLAVRKAIRDHEVASLKAAALTAYELQHYNALKLAGEYDEDIRDLVVFLDFYGDMANQAKKVFLAMLLADPIQ